MLDTYKDGQVQQWLITIEFGWAVTQPQKKKSQEVITFDLL